MPIRERLSWVRIFARQRGRLDIVDQDAAGSRAGSGSTATAKRLDFPEPDGPVMPDDRARPDDERDVVDRAEPGWRRRER